MDIKKVSKDSVTKVATLLRNYWKHRGMEYSLTWAKEYVLEGHRKEIKDDVFFVAKEREEILGCISLILSEGDVAELRDLVVEPAHRGKGIGERLVEYAQQWCVQNKVRKLFCCTFPHTQGFWLQQGFMIEGALKSHFKEGEDLVIMSKFIKKEDKQSSLQEKMQEIETIQSIEQGTAAMLKKLPTRKKL